MWADAVRPLLTTKQVTSPGVVCTSKDAEDCRSLERTQTHSDQSVGHADDILRGTFRASKRSNGAQSDGGFELYRVHGGTFGAAGARHTSGWGASQSSRLIRPVSERSYRPQFSDDVFDHFRVCEIACQSTECFIQECVSRQDQWCGPPAVSTHAARLILLLTDTA